MSAISTKSDTATKTVLSAFGVRTGSTVIGLLRKPFPFMVIVNDFIVASPGLTTILTESGKEYNVVSFFRDTEADLALLTLKSS